MPMVFTNAKEPDHPIIFANDSFLALTGYDLKETLGQSFNFVLASRDDPKTAAQVEAAFGSGAGSNCETRYRRKDGGTFWASTFISPILDKTGAVVQHFASFMDLTKHMHEQEQLRLASLYSRSLIEASLDPLLAINTDGKITDVNEAFVNATGVARDKLMGSDYSQYVTEPQRAVVGFREVLTRGFVKNYPLVILHVSGKTIEVLFNASIYRDESRNVSGVFAAARDITARRRAERALKTLSRGNEALVHAADEQQLLKQMCRVVVEAGGYVMASIGFAEHDEAKTVRPVAWAGNEAGYLKLAKLTWADSERGQGPTGTAIRTGTPQVNQNFTTDPHLALWQTEAKKRGYASSVALSLKANSDVIGALTIYAAEPDAFDSDELRLLVELADDLSYGIGALRARADGEAAMQALRKSLEATITALAGMVELRDPYTAGHQRNVSLLAAAIARDMGLSELDIEGIRLAGVVHDIGKINAPAEILSKPGKLSKIEFELIKMHAQAGRDIIKGVDFPWPVAQMILQHHERLDGSGYPNGLQGDAIVIGAKILAVADVVEAMMARRPYREALGLDAALAEIERGNGTLYDAAVRRLSGPVQGEPI